MFDAAVSASVNGLEPLLNLGAVGAVLAWFLLKAEPRMRAMEDAIDRLVRAQMLDILSRPEVAPAIKDQAQRLLTETGPDRTGTSSPSYGRRA